MTTTNKTIDNLLHVLQTLYKELHPLFLIIASGKKCTLKAENEVSNDFSLKNPSPGMSYKGKNVARKKRVGK